MTLKYDVFKFIIIVNSKFINQFRKAKSEEINYYHEFEIYIAVFIGRR